MTLPTEFLVYIAELLERLGIPYHVGGSVASSAHGMYRASADVDFVIDPSADQLEALARAMESEFYVSRPAMAEALSQRGTFNSIHDRTSFKIDFFIKGATPFDAEELRRSVRQVVGDERAHTVLLKSPEDTILRKLDWFRRGGEVSERQWQDVLSILAAARGQLDEAHLDRWSRELGVADLLDRARREVVDL
ncbi:MAG: nucleotidyl transferase AbiEii/AbiGii toxin family protein [Candidatus Eisenbacteria bacterium]|nr:nucleotidyl transferase AbiEii/AbiGii toxin family protein [Candidatus Eisenbacteria bacterium]